MQQSPPQYGRKARQLLALQEMGMRVPRFFVWSRSQIESQNAETILAGLLQSSFPDFSGFFAVRSSAVGEDSETSSMAGAFRTELGVRTDRIVSSSAAVLASYGTSAPGDCVIVQEFIPSDCAGVMFTDAGDGTCIINATFGLCETAVQGLAVDEFCLDRDGRELSTTIVSVKRCRFFRNGVIEEQTMGDSQPALNPHQVAQIFSIGKDIERALGAPQDIEWCFLGTELFILQSRPITRMVREEETFYDSANIAESYAGLILPLTFSFAQEVYRHVYQNLLVASGVSRKAVESHAVIFSNMLGLFCGRMYYNMNNWYRMMAFLPGYERNKKNLEGMISSNVREEVDRMIRPSLWLKLKYFPLVCGKLILFPWTVRRFQSEVRLMLDRIERALPQAKNCGELEALYQQLHRHLLSRWHVTVENDFLVMTFLGLLKRLLPDEETLIAVLRFKNVSAQQVRDLGLLGAEIFSKPVHKQLLENKEFEMLWKLIESDSMLQEKMNKYFVQYGGRFANELKLESPDLHEDHQLLLTVLHEYSRQQHSQIQQNIDQAHSQLFLVCLVLSAFRRSAAKREELRLLRSKSFSVVRSIFRRIGAELQKDGKIAHADDVFFLSIQEVFALVRDGNAQELVRTRKEEFEEYSSLRLRSHFSCRGRPSGVDLLQEHRVIQPATVLQGRGSTTGTVTGRVTLFPAFRIPTEPVEILVAEHTDPGWTPLIGLAKGMIIEHGGLLSHAAIVSRELGIPTVIGVENALAILRDAQTVTIDGSKGTVTIHP